MREINDIDRALDILEETDANVRETYASMNISIGMIILGELNRLPEKESELFLTLMKMSKVIL